VLTFYLGYFIVLSLHATDMICATLVNTQAHTQTEDRFW